jgi:tungstate transport system substrate-binding protein
MLEAAQADVAVTHAPAQETAALTRHPGWRYRKVLYNQFLIVGPPADPAQAMGLRAVDAMRRIAAAPVRFISRGDESGTHERERELWTAAQTRPAEGRLVVAGAGMGSTLRIAGETSSYTLTDEGTFAQLSAKVDLNVVSSGDPLLLNTYAVVADAANAGGMKFADWLARGGGRQFIAELLQRGALRGFTLWPEHREGTLPADRPR